MKQLFILLSLLFFSLLSFGQEKLLYVPTYEDGDTSYWFNWQQEKFEKAGLKKLTETNYALYFRFSTEIYAVDIWTENLSDFYGIVTNFTTSYDPDHNVKNQDREGEFFYCSKTLETSEAKEIYKLFKENEIFDIPPQDSIENWEQGEDGTTYFIEYSNKDLYSFKDYWAPSHYMDKIDEAKRINILTEQLEEKLKFEQMFLEFLDSLPSGTYKAGGIIVTTNSNGNNK
ncbi:hypothetical protein SAMN00777080_2826 [Aquiflexum balticum DSM 16537]|uniref:Uncharacterized protein n=1 Tax=Aquiflexum balticum DSM 16537 TaxID=758820 RepID=A0A1W2H5H2_9BACT|nr:hypothetical protein [Aquiflexum balticum]SMD44207.1 hypothetical protein SAMN00777080_2826 [Aquiflexum balticum DSM 16537]